MELTEVLNSLKMKRVKSIVKTVLKERNNTGEFTLSDEKIYYRYLIIRALWYLFHRKACEAELTVQK